MVQNSSDIAGLHDTDLLKKAAFDGVLHNNLINVAHQFCAMFNKIHGNRWTEIFLVLLKTFKTSSPLYALLSTKQHSPLCKLTALSIFSIYHGVQNIRVTASGPV